MSLLLLIILITLCSFQVFSYEIFWKLANYRETQVETCSRYGLKPLSMDNVDFAWNISTINFVSRHILNLSILSNVSNNYGILGCCVSSLWCTSDGCFTQSYGSKYINYGWLDSLPNAKPVYTCHNNTISGGKMKINSITQSGSKLFLYGANLGTEQNSLDISVHGSLCTKKELCNCQTCSSSQSCSLDSRCYKNFCFKTCAGTGDASCPCNQICNNVWDSSGIYVSLCLPSSYTSYSNNCASRGTDQMMCSANNTIYGQAYASLPNVTIDAVLDIQGAVVNSGNSISQKCTSHAQCFDGNICTTDHCGDNQYCIYTPMKYPCDSMLLSIRDSYTPYSYHVISMMNSNGSSQALFVSQLHTVGTSVYIDWTTNNKQLNDITTLSFWFVYYGNLINKVYITGGTGSISFPPIGTCSTQECILFTSATNTVAPWYSNQWTSGTITKYIQTKDHTPYIRNINANAFHILYENMIHPNHMHSATFATSVYEDGSIRSSYINGTNSFGNYTEDYAGLWGAFLSTNHISALRYHQENASLLLTDQQEIVYCPYNTIGCIPETCVTAGNSMTIHWNGTDSCTALNEQEYSIGLYCQWHGGINTTHASMIVKTNANVSSGILSCLVPPLDFIDGSIIPVQIITKVIKLSSQEEVPIYSNNNNNDYNKIIYGVTSSGVAKEITRANFMIRYYSKNSLSLPASGCGCNPLIASNETSNTKMMCNNQGICANPLITTNEVLDCAQTPFGSAFQDACNTCAGGYTKNIPVFSCDASSTSGVYDLLTQTIILLTVICCLTFLTSTISFSIRRMLINHAQQSDLMAEQMLVDLLEMANNNPNNNRNGANGQARGLSEFECEAIGTTVFTSEFYQNHKKHMAHKEENNTKEGEVIDFSDDIPTKEDTICECPICLMEIQEGNACRTLPDPCGHIFHQSCIDEWFKQSVVCPLCKRSMRTLMRLDEEITTTVPTDAAAFRGFTAFSIRHPNSEHPAIRWVLNLDDLSANYTATNNANNNTTNNRTNNSGSTSNLQSRETSVANSSSPYTRLSTTIGEDDIESPPSNIDDNNNMMNNNNRRE